ncbi:hypothetical protein DAPPUDRAFT_247535 [Daphnia pulex]|uniref:Replication factor-A protein 1 N-terminal domain-containing protein n=1 Tax=Daphnia pulex TaxID=6669 RepID=E9GSM5_DAPPU|nr:hypothetical protein DAPPUDRAFT_247535 [Daphnia pulex]|eukprot:EFX77455.1 hypothetical protein DAPPUDRAFT_247535 [Daphnia pulex]
MHQWPSPPKVNSSKPVLTNGAIPAIVEKNGLYNETPVLQDFRGLLQATDNNRYKIVLSDGKYSYAFAMLSAQLNHLIADGKLEIFTVVKVVRFTVNSVIAKAPATDKVYNKIITLHDVELLVSGKEVRSN